jgi:hypothetical protein
MKKTIKLPETDRVPAKSKTLKERIQKHLADRNDVITEEDIKNVKIGEETAEEKAAADTDAKVIEKTKLTSPWNVLSEEDK